jgi:hypothetical protein
MSRGSMHELIEGPRPVAGSLGGAAFQSVGGLHGRGWVERPGHLTDESLLRSSSPTFTMTQVMDNATPSPASPSASTRPAWLLPGMGAAALIVLVVVGLFFANRSGSSDEAADTTVESAASAAATTTTSTTSTTSTTMALPTTTAAAPASTPVSDPPATFSAESPYFGTFTLDLATEENGLTLYDGIVGDGPTLRCVVALAPGITTWNEWCGEPGAPTRFITTDGTNVWLVEIGADLGSVAAAVPPAEGTLTANGCTTPVRGLVTAAFPGPAVMTSVICVPGEAFVGNSAVFLQPGPADGGGILVQQAADGTWTSTGGGTDSPCDEAIPDGRDRCALYGLAAGEDLFQAVLPIPPIGASSATSDIIGMRDATADVRAAAGAATTATDIGDAVAAAFRQDAEDPAPTVQTFGDFAFIGVELAVVEVPAFDDSILKTTYAVWIRVPAAGQPVAFAFAFETCARGLAGPDLCI